MMHLFDAGGSQVGAWWFRSCCCILRGGSVLRFIQCPGMSTQRGACLPVATSGPTCCAHMQAPSSTWWCLTATAVGFQRTVGFNTSRPDTSGEAGLLMLGMSADQTYRRTDRHCDCLVGTTGSAQGCKGDLQPSRCRHLSSRRAHILRMCPVKNATVYGMRPSSAQWRPRLGQKRPCALTASCISHCCRMRNTGQAHVQGSRCDSE
jgi:hypothetical protein